LTQIQKTEEVIETQEAKLLNKLCSEVKQQLTVINEKVNKAESTKKEIIRNLAYNINDLGLCPTDMICDLIATKLKGIVPRAYITNALDSKYKNQNYKRKTSTNISYQESGVIIDYGESFDVRECQISEWHTYSDQVKKAWVIQLISDKLELQKEIIELQARLQVD
jgi:hypothetical protein